MKLAREQVPFLRLGREAGVHPAVRPWLPGGERYPQKSTREWARLAQAVPVVRGAGRWRGGGLPLGQPGPPQFALPTVSFLMFFPPTPPCPPPPGSLAPPALA